MIAERRASLAIAVLSLLAALPALVATYPQMADYPAHLARWHVMLNLDASAHLQRHYGFTWQWIPNLGADLMVWPLAKLFGLEAAGRVIAVLVPVLLAASLLTVDRVLHKRVGIGGLLALVTVWSPSVLMGFVNWGLGLALAFFAFAGWVAFEGRRWRPHAFLVIAPLVWLCHLSAWGVLGVLVFGHEWQRRGFLAAIARTWPLWPPALLTLLAGSGKGGTSWGDGVLVDKVSNWIMALRDQSAQLDLLTVVLLVGVAAIAWRQGRVDGRIGRAALIFAALSLVMPRHLGGGDFADYRLVPVALACAVLAARWNVPRWVLAAAAVPFVLRLALTTTAWFAGSAQTAQMMAAVDQLPRGSVIAGARAEDPFAWSQGGSSHVFALATVRRDAVTNSDFAVPGVHALTRIDGGPVDPSQRVLIATGKSPDLSAFAPARGADYLWYVGTTPPSALPPGAQGVASGTGWRIARLAKVTPSR
ncbi:hypothetical protein [Novosphingobium aquae]|uniref:Glycosyltransferase RgtA/B/C/D-like domain-containing protein n=1 Tax=Novosphingobium aquae TaxID=3133435 RepID=A0ABU8SCK6_9SPHN